MVSLCKPVYFRTLWRAAHIHHPLGRSTGVTLISKSATWGKCQDFGYQMICSKVSNPLCEQWSNQKLSMACLLTVLTTLTTLLPFFLVKWHNFFYFLYFLFFYIQELTQFNPKWSWLGFLNTSCHNTVANLKRSFIQTGKTFISFQGTVQSPSLPLFFQENEKPSFPLLPPS